MEASLYHTQTHYSTLPTYRIKHPSFLHKNRQNLAVPSAGRILNLEVQPCLHDKLRLRHRLDNGIAVGCGSWGDSVGELERELEAEMNDICEGEEWREKCKGRKGVVELLECLECQAITGEDEGREPTDYNRRALIFDKSSRVFRALKERSDDAPSHQS